MLAERNISSLFALLLSIEFKFLNTFQKTLTILKGAISLFSILARDLQSTVIKTRKRTDLLSRNLKHRHLPFTMNHARC